MERGPRLDGGWTIGRDDGPTLRLPRVDLDPVDVGDIWRGCRPTSRIDHKLRQQGAQLDDQDDQEAHSASAARVPSMRLFSGRAVIDTPSPRGTPARLGSR